MRILSILLFSLFSLLSTVSVMAQTGPWDDSFDFSKVRLVSAKESLDGSNTVRLGLEFDVADGWNIYWRAPGPVGLPPVLNWQDLSQIQDTEMLWPIPSRYTYTIPGDDTGIESMIYRGRTILPIDVTIADPNQPLVARGVVEYMVCQEQCIFGEANVSLDLFTGGPDAPLSEHAADIAMFSSQVPLPASDDVGLGLANHTWDATNSTLTFDVRSPLALSAPDVLIEASEEDTGFVFGTPTVTLSQDATAATVTIPVDEIAFSGATPADTDFRLTVVDSGRGVDLGFVRIGSEQGISQAAWAQTTVDTGAGGLSGDDSFGPEGWTLVGLMLAAIAAGFILNLMPCVLPVLSLKMMAFVGKADQDNGEIRRSFLATAAGIIASFWALALLVIALQAAGGTVGWGFQFQSPWFVSLMIATMVVFAANMFGWFELPAIPGLAGVGAGKKGPAADFMTGALATLLATPCSAPLLAPVIGVAFAGSPLTILGLFTLIGIGMAVPYWLVIAFPSVARVMPKPGAWMMVLKSVLGLLLLAFALFLIWVLMTQLGVWVAGLSLVLSLAVLVGLFLGRARLGLLVPALVAFLGLGLVPAASASFLPNQQVTWFSNGNDEGKIDWQDFDEGEIASLVADGKTVFVDVTASWCVNCRFNKAVALDPKPVRREFEREDIVAMVADWTNHDEDIGIYLSQFGRAGIPFNIVYSPANPNGVVLPTALTQQIVLDALDS